MNTRGKHEPMDSTAAVLRGFEWNECLPEGMEDVHPYLVSLICIEPGRGLKCIGTAFIVGAYGNNAIAISAAHNFWDAIGQFQNKNSRHQPSACPLFLPNFENICVDWHKVRAIYQVGERIELCVIKFAIWDKAADIAVLKLVPEDEQDSTVFNNYCRLGHITPRVGDIVGCLGYGNMDTFQENNNWKKGHIQRRAILRVGRVLNLHPEGHSLVRGPCIETSIPVFGGMSGGPVFLLPERGMELVPFALISSDPKEPDEVKNDRSQAGSSIMAMLPLRLVSEDEDKTKHFGIRLEEIGLAGNAEFDHQTGSSNVRWIPD